MKIMKIIESVKVNTLAQKCDYNLDLLKNY